MSDGLFLALEVDGDGAHPAASRQSGRPDRSRYPGGVRLDGHVVDLLALAPGDGSEIVAARTLKGELCALRGREASSYVSRSFYRVTW